MSQSGGNSKAVFQNLDGGSDFTVQYNPREFTVEKSVTWEEAQTQGQSSNPIQFQKGSPMTASMELLFDTTADDPPGNVQKVWVDSLLSLTNANVTPTSGEAAELGKQRPPSLQFTWGTFTMKCVIESVNVTYLMFAAEGHAVRARCTVKLKEWQVEEIYGSGSSSTWSSAKLVLVEGGQTVSQVASSYNTDARQVMQDNGITDGMSDITGQTLVVRNTGGSSRSSSSRSSGSRR